MRKLYLPFLFLLMLTSCVSFSVKDAQDGIVLAKATLTGVNNTITTLVTNKQITPDQAQALANKADQAKGHIKTAESLAGQGKPQDALGALKLANALLLDLQRQLESKR